MYAGVSDPNDGSESDQSVTGRRVRASQREGVAKQPLADQVAIKLER